MLSFVRCVTVVVVFSTCNVLGRTDLETFPTSTSPLRLLALGDSITAGGVEGTWRRDLQEMLTAHGYMDRIDFTGQVCKRCGAQSEEATVLCSSCYYSDMTDVDHEGHWSWRVDEILAGTHRFPNDGKLSEWLGDYDVDVALVHLGTNNVFFEDPHAITKQLQQVFQQLQNVNPHVVIFVARIIPVSKSFAAEKLGNAELVKSIPFFNDVLSSTLDAQTQPSAVPSNVHVVDMYDGFDAVVDTWDGVHPNKQGDKKIAAKWMHALLPWLQKRFDAIAIDDAPNDNDKHSERAEL